MKAKITIRRAILISAFVLVFLGCSAATVRLKPASTRHASPATTPMVAPSSSASPTTSPIITPLETPDPSTPQKPTASSTPRPAITPYPQLTPHAFTPPYHPFVQVAPWQFGYSSVEGNSGSYRYVDFYTQASYANGDVTMTIKYVGRLASNGQLSISGSKAVFIPAGYHTTSLDTIITVAPAQCPYGDQITGSFALYYPDGVLMQAYADQTINCPNN